MDLHVPARGLLQEHLRWEKAHVVGHSMGGMAAMKLAAMVPARVASLSVISSTGGGWQSVPSTWRAIRYAWRVRPPATRASRSLNLRVAKPFCHYSLEFEAIRAIAEPQPEPCIGGW